MSIDEQQDEVAFVHVAERRQAWRRARDLPVSSRAAKRLKARLVFADVAAVLVALISATFIAGANRGWESKEVLDYLKLSVLTVPLWPLLFAQQHLYAARFVGRLFDEVRRFATAVISGFVGIVVVGWVIDQPVSRGWTIIGAVAVTLMLTLERAAARSMFRSRRRQGRGLRDVIIVGTNAEAMDLYRSLRDPDLGYHVVAFAVPEGDHEPAEELAEIDGVHVVPIRNLIDVSLALGASGVVIATSAMDARVSNTLLRDLLDVGLHVELTTALRDITPDRMTVRPLGRHPVMYLEPTPRRGWRMGAKRIFDVLVAGALLLIVSPVLLVSAVIIRLTSPGPAFFRQERVGLDGHGFVAFKLRSMVENAEEMLVDLTDRNEADGPLFKMADDPRVTPFGRFIRRTSIDELPQLWNVVRGDMSLVGPRPALPHEVAQWEGPIVDRLRVRPGITGIWQVSGRSSADFADYQRLDLYYVDNWSILVDVGILLKTVPAVLFARGAY